MYIEVTKVRDSWGIEYIIPNDMVEDFFRLYNPALPEEFKNKFFGMECYDFREEEFFTKTENGFENLYPKEVTIKMCVDGEYFDWDWELFIPYSILEEYENDVVSLLNKSMKDVDFEKKYSTYDAESFNSVYQKGKK